MHEKQFHTLISAQQKNKTASPNAAQDDIKTAAFDNALDKKNGEILQKDIFNIHGTEKITVIVTSASEKLLDEPFFKKNNLDYIIIYTEDYKKFTYGLESIKKLKKILPSYLIKYGPKNIFFTGYGLGCSTLLPFIAKDRIAKKVPAVNCRLINPPRLPAEELTAAYKNTVGKYTLFSPFIIAGINLIFFYKKIRYNIF